MSYSYEQQKKKGSKKTSAETFVSGENESCLPNSAMVENLGHQVDMPVVMREKMEDSFGMDISAASAAGPMQAKSGKKKKESNGSGGNWFSRLFGGLFNKKQKGMNVVTDSDEDEKSYFDDIYVTDNPKYEDEEDML